LSSDFTKERRIYEHILCIIIYDIITYIYIYSYMINFTGQLI